MGSCCPRLKRAAAVAVTIDKNIVRFYGSSPSAKLHWKLIRQLTSRSDRILFSLSKTSTTDKRTIYGSISRAQSGIDSLHDTQFNFVVVSVVANKTWFAEETTTVVYGNLETVILLSNQVLSPRIFFVSYRNVEFHTCTFVSLCK